MLLEIHTRLSKIGSKVVKTIYFGGGTPSLFPPDKISNLIQTVGQYLILDKVEEISLEANPEDINHDYLLGLKQIGINRLSLGVQSFDNSALHWMNRGHTVSQSEIAIQKILDSTLDLSIDLIYGIPQSSHEQWSLSLEKMNEYQIKHFSAYALTVEENTKLHHEVFQKKAISMNDEFTCEQMDILLDFCELNDYEDYEISNFCKTGFRAKHNALYWQQQPYLGFGPAAHSYLNDYRSWNIANNNQYISLLKEGKPIMNSEKLTEENKWNEFIMLNVRKKEGICINSIPDNQNKNKLLQKLKQLHQEDILILQNDCYTLSRKGKHIADFITLQLL